MDQRRQGMICVGLGLGMLGGFAWFEAFRPAFTNAPQLANSSSTAVANFTVRETLDGACERECLRLRYHGEGFVENFVGRTPVHWDVDVYRLPADANGLIPHVVHVDKHHGEGLPHLHDSIESGDSVTACWMDREGKLVRSIMPPGAPLPQLDPAAFLMPLPDFTSRGRVRLAKGSDGSHWQIEAASARGDDSDQIVVEVVSDSVAQRVEQIERHIRFCYDRLSRVMLSMEYFERGHWRQKHGESKSQLELVGASEIPLDRVASMTADLKSWEKFHHLVRQLARQASLPPRAVPPSSAAELVSMSAPIPSAGAAPLAAASSESGVSVASFSSDPQEPPSTTLEELPSFSAAVYDSISDSVLQSGLASGLYSLQASRFQLLGERPSVAALHRTECLTWNSTDLTGVARSGSDYRGKPVVMSFLCRGTPHATRTIKTVAELRQRFPDDQVAVLAFATTYSRQNAEAISRAMGPSIPVFHDLRLAERMNLFTIGKSTVIVLDGFGKPRFVHTWQPLDLVDEICSQIEEIRSPPTSSPPTPESGALKQITLPLAGGSGS